jgi:hypothetical protein
MLSQMRVCYAGVKNAYIKDSNFRCVQLDSNANVAIFLLRSEHAVDALISLKAEHPLKLRYEGSTMTEHVL